MFNVVVDYGNSDIETIFYASQDMLQDVLIAFMSDRLKEHHIYYNAHSAHTEHKYGSKQYKADTKASYNPDYQFNNFLQTISNFNKLDAKCKITVSLDSTGKVIAQ